MVAGDALGPALVLEDGVSFAMAFDPESGLIRDTHSSAAGTSVTGTVLVMPTGRGSSSASTSLAEAIRSGTAPTAIILGEIDEILAVGAIVARRLYGRICPIMLLDDDERQRIENGMMLAIDAHGWVAVGE